MQSQTQQLLLVNTKSGKFSYRILDTTTNGDGSSQKGRIFSELRLHKVILT